MNNMNFETQENPGTRSAFVALVGKPVALMNKEDKVRAIRFLNQNGAFLVTKSGDKIAKYFGISKYTLYSYIDSKQQEGK